MACGNTSQLINVKSFRKTPCVPFANQSSTQLHLHCMPAGLWRLCVYFFVVSISSELLAAVATVYLHSFPSPGQQISPLHCT